MIFTNIPRPATPLGMTMSSEPIFGTTIAPGQTVRTQVLRRQADNAIFRYQELGGQGSASLTVEVYHKDLATTTWTSASASFQSGAAEVHGLKEEITIEFSMAEEELAFADFPVTVTASNRRVRLLPIQWFDDALYVAP